MDPDYHDMMMEEILWPTVDDGEAVDIDFDPLERVINETIDYINEEEE